MILLLKLAFRNAISHWKQSLSALISVAAGFIAFALFDGYMRDIFTIINQLYGNIEMYGDYIIEHENANKPEGRSHPWDWALDIKAQNMINDYFKTHESEIFAYSRFLNIEGSIDTNNSSFVFIGYGYDILEGAKLKGKWKWNTYWGKPLHEIKDNYTTMLMGRRLGQFMGCLPEKLDEMKKYFIDLELHPLQRPFTCENETFQLTTVTEKGQINATDLSVAGLYDQGFKEFDERYVVMPLETAQQMYDTQKVNFYTLKLKSDVDKNIFANQFQNYLMSIGSTIKIIDWRQHSKGSIYRQTLSLLETDRTFVITIIIFVGCLSIFNTLIKLIKERTFEIGMLRSLGFLPQFIRKLFILESILLSWIGCIWGIILSFIIAIIINKSEITYPSGLFSFESPLRIEINFMTYVNGVLLMTLLSIIAGFIAIRKPSSQTIANSLIHN